MSASDLYVGFNGQTETQQDDELRALLELIKEEKVSRYLEIGLYRGTTFHAVAEVLPPDSNLVGIDLPGDVEDGPYQIDLACSSIRNSLDQKPVVIWGNSHNKDTKAAARSWGPYDMVFIDGDHTYDGTWQDWYDYGINCRIVVFHDIVSRHWSQGCAKVWRELKTQYRHREIVGVCPDMGIGVLWRY